ncbi:type II toxin-antitoxin system PemK/MazF family toxin, partial [Gammaproteobacteria bacterium AB-CW1]|nr:type II toxin-antitoxin system PemK/MazF family toxin [Gammaproteobacteria bacterium AB-CW1]
MAVSPRLGEVWVARLNPNQGREIGKVRPVAVLQADELTEAGLPTVLVAPLTTQRHEDASLLRIEVTPRDRLLKASYVCAEHLRAIDRNRLGEGPLTRLTPVELRRVQRALRGCLAM